MGEKEQRSYYRVDDLIKMNWVKVENPDEQGAAELEVEILEINEKLGKMISVAFQESAAVGEVLGLLNRKIDLLATKSEEQMASPKTVMASISGAGMGFAWEEPAEKGDIIDLMLVLKPSNVFIKIRANVVGCDESKHAKQPWWIRAAFRRGQDIAVEEIIQHVSWVQTQLLAERHQRGQIEDATDEEAEDEEELEEELEEEFEEEFEEEEDED